MAPRTRKAGVSPSPAPSNGDTPPAPPPKDDTALTPGISALLVPSPAADREEVKVNNASASDIMPRTEGSAVRQTLIVKEDGKPSTQFVSPHPGVLSCAWLLIVGPGLCSNWGTALAAGSSALCTGR